MSALWVVTLKEIFLGIYLVFSIVLERSVLGQNLWRNVPWHTLCVGTQNACDRGSWQTFPVAAR